jgi:V8-like Glu-specific endopeptidase
MTYTLSASQTFPYSDVCMITVTIDGASYRGSGVIIGPHTILTAAHMMWDASTGTQSTNVHVYPAYTGTNWPTTGGVAPSAVHYVGVNDANDLINQASSSYDFAVIDVATTFSSWFNLLPNYAGGTVNATGYPGYPTGVQSGPQSYQQWTTQGTVTTDAYYNILNYGTLATQPGNSGGPLWINQGTASNPQPALVGLVSTSGWAFELTSSSYNTIQNWITADSSMWTAQPAPSAAVTAFANAETAARSALGWGTDLDACGITTAAGTNSVIGWESANLPHGNNAVVLDGARSGYQVQIDGTGQLMVHNISSGQNIVVDGASYLLFNGASGNGAGAYDQILFIEGGANGGQDAALARLYQAALGRIPDLAGLEGWKGVLDNGAQTIDQIANQFIGSAEFTARYGSALTNTQFVTALYQNVLGRAPDPVGLAGWVGALNSGAETRSQELLGFANGQECINKVSIWLIDTTQGGYADSGLLLDAATVVNQAVTNHTLDLALINPTTISSKGVESYNYTSSSGYYLTSTSITVLDANATVTLAGQIKYAYLDGNADTVYGSSATISISSNGVTDNVILSSTATTTIYAKNNTSIYGFIEGKDVVKGGLNFFQPEVILDGSSGQTTNGVTLNFQNNFYILKVGAVGGGSAAEVASAVNHVYTLAGSAWTNTTWPELLEVVGQTSVGNTLIYGFGTGFANPDTNGNHQVDAAELTLLATLVGIQSSTLTTHDLG